MRTFSPRSAARDTKRPRFLATIGTIGLATAFAFVVGPGTASALPANCVQPVVDGPVTCTFTFTGGEQSLPIPAGVTSVYVVATGGSGGDKRFDGTGVGGLGATATGNVAVSPASTLYVLVGGTGDIISPPSPSFNGGGTSYSPGGGASDVRTVSGTDVAALNSRLLVAGAGGGAARDVNGGNAGAPGITDPGIQGGGGGGAGTAVSGGGGGTSSAFDGGGSPGGLGFGGAGTTEGGFLYGGGGGGGLYGGGGGGAGGDGGGGSGGGGSSLIPAGGTIGVAAVGIAPQIVITYQVGATPPAPNCFGSVCLPAM